MAGITNDDECRFCMEDQEDTWHVINECPALVETRRSLVQNAEGQVLKLKYPEDVLNLPVFFDSIGSLFSPMSGTE